MTNLVTLVMQRAAIEVLQEEADQIDEEVRRLLAEIERTPVEEYRRGSFAQCFLESLKRRGEVAGKAILIFKEAQSETPRAPEPVNWTMLDFAS
jgi:beta-glucosidase-like glycosyl hydrolase